MDNKEIPKKNSTRHHYIPKFLTNGFADNEGLYVYDKEKDVVLKNKRSSKSIFFENDRNTIDLPANKQSTIIEDLLFREIDDKCSKVILKYQAAELKEIKFTQEELAAIMFFKISLFWRIPRNDKTADDVIDRAEIIIGDEKAKELKLNSGYKKILRSGFFQHHIAEITKMGIKGEGFVKLHDLSESSLIIGDFPFIFRKQLKLFSEFNDHAILFAISNSRIYTSSKKSISNFSHRSALYYNALVILHSVKYVATSDLKILKASIGLFKKIELDNVENFYKIAFCEM